MQIKRIYPSGFFFGFKQPIFRTGNRLQKLSNVARKLREEPKNKFARDVAREMGFKARSPRLVAEKVEKHIQEVKESYRLKF